MFSPSAAAGGVVSARLARLTGRLDGIGDALGFPAACDVDWSPLAEIFTRGLLNNLGDPFVDGLYPFHTKDVERDAIGIIADLFHAPADDRWGYVAGNASEAALYGLDLAARLHPNAVVLHSAAAHPAISKAARLARLRSVVLRTDPRGELDYDDFADQVAARRDRPIVVVANAGSTFSEAVDDVRRITTILDELAVPSERRLVLVDAALSGIPLATLDPTERPGFDFADGADCIFVSGHKFLATPMPCAAVIVRASLRARAPVVSYTGAPDATISTSRNGHAALAVWYALTIFGRDGLTARAVNARDLAAHLHTALGEQGWPAWRNPHAMTVTLATPPHDIRGRWGLADHGGRSHIVCAPGVTRDRVTTFLAELADHTPTPEPGRVNGQAVNVNGRRVPRQLRPSAPAAVGGDHR
ncbi:aminotransferase class V-fold PLP-dependent enzyme [Asanoa siamensis]|uniref:Histidine decarboxylase n=1 Tax=Asanoa siamensis TaxID=926357 RepID=A0ABQ4CS80_9ACTN|nr:aminotransferase class V-fold PLP-dependent enzyme [Asanoa siamensis]GIF74149.1 histidine decarboxylase [Asanoa siamensis]